MKNKFKDGINLFNKRKFFEAHEIWEKLWLSAKEEKKFLQGLIFIAGGYYHYQNKNIKGTELFLKKGCEYLSTYSDKYVGVDIKKLRDDTINNLEKIKKDLDIKFLTILSKF